ncbi:hypothetical protein S40288_07985 [Stachybotrys chartarum IBT 40288]|nr:hypothetical protein S40288_07985 [Stachybotrys chartarum IBT 40288]
MLAFPVSILPSVITGIMDVPAQQLVEQADLFAALTGVIKPKPWDMFFLVMGRTGSGKSTFISHCVGKNVKIGHGLFSCTNTIDVFDMHWNGRRIFLVDTPGFNDTHRSDIEVLETLASCLSASYANNVRIHGIILLHAMSDNRISGSSLRNINMMKALCGLTRYDNLAIVTTLWPCSRNRADQEEIEARYNELILDERFFGELVLLGAKVFQHDEKGSKHGVEAAASARRVVAHLVRRADMHSLDVLQLQREMVDVGKTLGRTAAGTFLAEDVRQRHKAHEQKLRELKKDTQMERAHSNDEYSEEIHSFKEEVAHQFRKLKAENKALEKSIVTMHDDVRQQWTDYLSQLERDFQRRLKEKEQKLCDMEELDRQRRQRISTWPLKADDKDETSNSEDEEKQEKFGNLRKEVFQLRQAKERFSGYKQNIVNGAMNGIAASMTAGVVASKLRLISLS